MFIFEVLIYVAFAFYASSLARKSENYIEQSGASTSVWDPSLKAFVAFFTIIAAIRFNVGSDCLSYSVILDRCPPREGSQEKLWDWMLNTIHEFDIHWAIGLGICGFVQIFFITAALKPYRWLIVFLPFVFLGGRYWMDCMGAVRQMMAAAIFLWASRFIYDKKPVKYVASIFVASLIHHSALALLPFVFVPKWLQLENRRTLLLVVLGVCFIMGQIRALGFLTGFLGDVGESTDYSAYGTAMTKAISNNYTGESLAFGPMMLSYLLISIYIIVYGAELKERYAERVPYFSLWFNLAYLYACAYFLVCNVGHIFIRPTQYFSFFQMVMAAMLLHYLWTEYKATGARQMATLMFCAIIAVSTSWDVTKASTSGARFEASTYKTIFFNQDFLNRIGLKVF